MNSSISVVIPVFNSAASLPELLRRLDAVLKSSANTFEVILVNDGSHDSSETVLSDLRRQYAWVQVISLMRNYGQHNALLCGIRAAHHPICVTLDDDLQNPPEEIPKLLQTLQLGIDVVYGTAIEDHYTPGRGIMTRLVKWALGIAMDNPVANRISSFRAFRTELRETFAHFENPYVSMDVLLSWSTTRFAVVPVAHGPRAQGRSQYSLLKLITYTLNVLMGFSTLPLRLATILGLGLSVFGIGVLAFVTGRYLINHGSVPGFPFLASLIAIFSGSQLCALGILGEYISRIYLKTIQRPAYVVKPAADLRPGA